MNQLTTALDENNQLTIPLIVAQRWNFPLAHIQTEDGIFYAVQDWIRGLTGEEDIRHLLAMLRSKNPQFDTLVKKYPYKSRNNKIHQRPYTKEDGLLFILVYTRLIRGRNRLVEIRNFIASLLPEYEHLKCREVKARVLSESAFQANIVEATCLFLKNCELSQYYQTNFGRKVDIVIIPSEPDNQKVSVLIECKVAAKDFYKALGQLIAYQSELRQSIPSAGWILAIAMPYEIIDSYMKAIISTIPVHLISLLNGTIIDVVPHH
jgi:hypothetical protein